MTTPTFDNPLPPRALIGMVHLAPLPGSPANTLPLQSIIGLALADAQALAQAGFDALMIENFGDAPFRATRVDPHTVACMTVLAQAVRAASRLPIGINVLRNDALAAVAIATTCAAALVRINVHCGVYATDQGIIEGRADDTLRYRQALGSRTRIFADVHVKHARPLSSASISDAAEEIAYRGRADALIVSGTATGKPTDLDDVRAVKAAVPDRPVYVGSGATSDNVHEILSLADGVIVGTAIKRDTRTTAPVDPARAAAFVHAARVRSEP
jgi:membrane complex biogenesis BtpA family protein